VVAGLAGGDGLGVAGGARVLDPAAAAGGDPGGQGGERDDQRDEACQFFELDSKNLPGTPSPRRTKSPVGFIEFVG
jgi:hypothetical protein